MNFSEVNTTIQNSKQHLNSNKSFGTVIENYITNYLLIYVYALFEQQIKNILTMYISSKCNNNLDIQSLIAPYIENMAKRIKTSDISNNVIAKINTDLQKKYNERLEENLEIKQIVTAYNNIIINRNLVAHGSGINITFDEFVISYDKAVNFFKILEDILGIDK